MAPKNYRLDHKLYNALIKYASKPVIYTEIDKTQKPTSGSELLLKCTQISQFITAHLENSGEPDSKKPIGKVKRVAVMAENSGGWVYSAFATVFSQATLVALDAHLTDEEAELLLTHSEATLLISDKKTLDHFFLGKQDKSNQIGQVSQILTIDERPQNLSQYYIERISSFDELKPAAKPLTTDRFGEDETSEAVLIYTSGTTGDPKGVQLAHRALCSVIDSAMKKFPAVVGDNFLGILPFQHILPMVATLFGPICIGGQTTIVNSFRGPVIKKAMQETGVSVMIGTPKLFDIFLSGINKKIKKAPPWKQTLVALFKKLTRLGLSLGINLSPLLFGSLKKEFGGRLEKFISGGSRLDPRIYEGWLDFGWQIQQGYGLSETTAATTLTPRGKYLNDTVGDPLEWAEIKIDKPNNEGIGEVLIAGDGLMMGYLKNEEATKEVFDGKWFKTGDLGKIDHGFLAITGRSKNVIILANGKNVYPEDVEIFYSGNACVKEMAVLGSTVGEDEVVSAILVPTSEFENDHEGFARQWKEHCKKVQKTLPTYKHISKIFITNEPLPRTPSMKVRLPEVKKMLMSLS